MRHILRGPLIKTHATRTFAYKRTTTVHNQVSKR